MSCGTRRRIVLVGPAYPFRGGIAHFGEQLSDALEAHGHSVEMVTFSRQYPSWLFPGQTQVVSEEDVNAQHYRWIDTINPVSWWRTARKIRSLQPDAVLFQHWMPFFAPAYGSIARLLKRYQLPSYGVVHNALPHERHLGDVCLNQYFYQACKGFITLSESVQDELLSLGVSGSVELGEHPPYNRFGDPATRDEARQKLNMSPDAEVLLFFGFIRPYKGLDTLIKALPRILQRRPNVKLLVAGEFYKGLEATRNRIRKLGVDHAVQIVPRYIPDQEVPYFFAAANVIVQPYQRASQSGVAHIALHFGRPVIVTNVGGLSEFVGSDIGIIVPPDDSGALAAAVTRYFEDDLEVSFSRNIQDRVRQDKGNKLVGTVLSLIEPR